MLKILNLKEDFMTNKSRASVVHSALQACTAILKEINFGTCGSTQRCLPIFVARLETTLLNSRSVVSDKPEFTNHIKSLEKNGLELESTVNSVTINDANQKWGETQKRELNDIVSKTVDSCKCLIDFYEGKESFLLSEEDELVFPPDDEGVPVSQSRSGSPAFSHKSDSSESFADLLSSSPSSPTSAFFERLRHKSTSSEDIHSRDISSYTHDELCEKLRYMEMEKEILKKQVEAANAKHQETMLLVMNYISSMTPEDPEQAEKPRSRALSISLPEDARDFKEDLKVRLEKEFLRVFPNSELPQFLERVITEPRLKLLDALASDLEGINLNVLVGVLICIFESKGKSMRLIQWCIRQEVSKCKEINTVFREDSIYSKIVKSYMNMIGKNYLENVLSKTVKKVGSTKESYEIYDSTSTESLENRKINAKKLEKRVQKLLDTIFRSLPSMPFQIRKTCKYMEEELAERFSKEEALKYVGSFLFLRFFCPPILAPSFGGTDVPNREGQRGLVLVCKLLQHLGNGTVTNESNMQHFNDIVVNNRKHFHQFVQDIIVDEPAPVMVLEYTPANRLFAQKEITAILKKKLKTINARVGNSDPTLSMILSVIVKRETGEPTSDDQPLRSPRLIELGPSEKSEKDSSLPTTPRSPNMFRAIMNKRRTTIF